MRDREAVGDTPPLRPVGGAGRRLAVDAVVVLRERPRGNVPGCFGREGAVARELEGAVEDGLRNRPDDVNTPWHRIASANQYPTRMCTKLCMSHGACGVVHYNAGNLKND